MAREFIKPALVEQANVEVERAVERVSGGECSKASVALGISVSFDKDGALQIDYQLKGAGSKKGSLLSGEDL